LAAIICHNLHITINDNLVCFKGDNRAFTAIAESVEPGISRAILNQWFPMIRLDRVATAESGRIIFD
jgi:hypothetical protein